MAFSRAFSTMFEEKQYGTAFDRSESTRYTIDEETSPCSLRSRTSHSVQAAMSLISSTLFVLPSDTLFHSLALAPTDPRFPSTALLHSLCAIGASMCPLPEEASSYWRSEASPSSYHFRQAKTHLQAFNIGTVLDNARAALLLCVYSFATEQFIEVWSLIGLACRSVAPAGLNVGFACYQFTLFADVYITARSKRMRNAYHDDGDLSRSLPQKAYFRGSTC